MIAEDLRSPHYWLGALWANLTHIERVLAKEGHPEAASLRRALDEYESTTVFDHRREVVALAVKDATGECYAIRDTHEQAEEARASAINYLHGAETCGHPLAAGWVAKRLPFRVVMVTAEEREELLEQGTPTLDREG